MSRRRDAPPAGCRRRGANQERQRSRAWQGRAGGPGLALGAAPCPIPRCGKSCSDHRRQHRLRRPPRADRSGPGGRGRARRSRAALRGRSRQPPRASTVSWRPSWRTWTGWTSTRGEYRRLVARSAGSASARSRPPRPMSGRLLNRPTDAMSGVLSGKAPIARRLVQLRRALEDLDPAKYGLASGREARVPRGDLRRPVASMPTSSDTLRRASDQGHRARTLGRP